MDRMRCWNNGTGGNATPKGCYSNIALLRPAPSLHEERHKKFASMCVLIHFMIYFPAIFNFLYLYFFLLFVFVLVFFVYFTV
jgi:hypothetical protein